MARHLTGIQTPVINRLIRKVKQSDIVTGEPDTLNGVSPVRRRALENLTVVKLQLVRL